MKCSELKRKTPLVAKKPMSRGKPLQRGAVRMRAKKLAADKPKRAAREREERHLADLCRGQECFLLVPGIIYHNRSAVVPCHSNQLRHGKGKGIKAHDRYTVPGCDACHREIDQGNRFSKAEKFAIWDRAYERWSAYREERYGVPTDVSIEQ